jgi:type II secretory pathway pseudopilin PulG
MQRARAFTFVELMTVVAILTLMATLVIVNVSISRVRAQKSVIKSDISQAGRAIEIAIADVDVSDRMPVLNYHSIVPEVAVLQSESFPAGAGINMWSELFTGNEPTKTRPDQIPIRLTETVSPQVRYCFYGYKPETQTTTARLLNTTSQELGGSTPAAPQLFRIRDAGYVFTAIVPQRYQIESGSSHYYAFDGTLGSDTVLPGFNGDGSGVGIGAPDLTTVCPSI